MTAHLVAQPAKEKETLILLADDVLVGTASLVKNDLPSRRELTRWLASVLVIPPFEAKDTARGS